MASLDEILNVGIPLLLIIIVLGFLWTKFFRPFVLPMLSDMWNKASEKREEAQQNKQYGKDILYE